MQAAEPPGTCIRLEGLISISTMEAEVPMGPGGEGGARAFAVMGFTDMIAPRSASP